MVDLRQFGPAFEAAGRLGLRRTCHAGEAVGVGPTSNVVIANRFESRAEHPLWAIWESGLLVTINTDDPAMTDLDLGREYRAVAEDHDMSVESLAALAVEGIESTWLDDSEKSELRAEFEATTSQILGAAGS